MAKLALTLLNIIRRDRGHEAVGPGASQGSPIGFLFLLTKA